MNNKTLMIQGTTSDAGKSTVVTALCRVLLRQNISVAPFKPQNMALNSAVTKEGGEIGRAQAVQAQAAGLEPHVDMNPVLLKPTADKTAQVIIHGKAIKDMNARSYHQYKTIAMEAVLASHQRLVGNYGRVLVEGAGSPAEINLRENDIANMGFAEAVDCPVILVADIDRGGVFAHLVGTLELLSPSERNRVQGFIINRFRGDVALLQPGLDWLEERTGKPVLGVLPYMHGMHLEAEDALQSRNILETEGEILKVIVPVTPRISNHTDFDALRLHPQVDLQFIRTGESIPPADLMILPGSKSVRADLDWLRAEGWPAQIEKHLRYGGCLLGICGGMQMLGQHIHDPMGIEGEAGSSEGLGWLDFSTTLEAEKQLRRVKARLNRKRLGLNKEDVVDISGYEIHAGVTSGPALEHAAIEIQQRNDGGISEDRQILGTYLHGLFDTSAAMDALLEWAGLERSQSQDYQQIREDGINQLADAFEQHMAMDNIKALLSL